MGMYGTYVAITEKQAQEIKKNPSKLFDVDSDIRLDIDKSWEAIHYVLCADISDGELPMGNVVPMHMDNFLDLEEMQYGAFMITSNALKEVYEYMTEVDKELFKSMYDIEELIEEEIYPLSPEDADEGEEFFEYLYENFEAIEAFYKKVLDLNMSVIFYIS